MKLTRVELYTDGSCYPNPGPGGWGFVLVSPAGLWTPHEAFGSGENTTNNRMEMRAVICGLRTLTRRCEVTVVTDSKYVMTAFSEGYLAKWKRDGWLTSRGTEVLNRDLWAVLAKQVDRHDVTFKWIKGHSGHEYNELADRLALRGRLEGR